VIAGLKDLLNTCQTTYDQLNDAIPKLSTIIDLMSNVSNIWADVVDNLDDIKDRESLW